MYNSVLSTLTELARGTLTGDILTIVTGPTDNQIQIELPPGHHNFIVTALPDNEKKPLAAEIIPDDVTKYGILGTDEPVTYFELLVDYEQLLRVPVVEGLWEVICMLSGVRDEGPDVCIALLPREPCQKRKQFRQPTSAILLTAGESF